MKRLLAVRFAAAAALVAGSASVAGAVDVVNTTADSFEIAITENQQVMSMEIKANETLIDVCGECVVEVPGIGEVTATGDERVVITADSVKIEG